MRSSPCTRRSVRVAPRMQLRRGLRFRLLGARAHRLRLAWRDACQRAIFSSPERPLGGPAPLDSGNETPPHHALMLAHGAPCSAFRPTLHPPDVELSRGIMGAQRKVAILIGTSKVSSSGPLPQTRNDDHPEQTASGIEAHYRLPTRRESPYGSGLSGTESDGGSDAPDKPVRRSSARIARQRHRGRCFRKSA